MYTRSIGTGQPELFYATAIGLFNSVINFLLIVVVNQVSKRLGQSSLW